jgi:sugar lactone lactonase YvrE
VRHLWRRRILHFTSEGRINRVVGVPAANLTSCCLGGYELRTSFITSGEGAENEFGGAVFAVEVDVPVFRNHCS